MSGANSSSPAMPAFARRNQRRDAICDRWVLINEQNAQGLFALDVDRRGQSAKTAESYRSLEGVFLPILAAMKFRITPPDYNPNGARCATKRGSLHYLRHIKTMFRQRVATM